MSETSYLTTREVAELLRLKERKVYDLAASASIPCTKATGKLLFPRTAVLEWLRQHSTGTQANDNIALFCGSHDPLLEWAIRESRCGIATLFDGSVDGCVRLAERQATVAAMHIFDSATSTWNIDYVQEHHSHNNCVLVRFIERSRGLVFSPELDIGTFADVKDHRIVIRQPGAGSQITFEAMLQQNNIDIATLNIALVARSESDAVLAIVEGNAECTMGLRAIAMQHNLGYLHLINEPLDLLVDRQFWFEPEMQTFLDFCRSSTFKNRVAALSGYQVCELFSVQLNP